MSNVRRARIAKQIVQLLGGASAVSRLVDAPVSTVQSWELNGIPDWRISGVEAAAAARGVKIPPIPRKAPAKRSAAA